MSALFKATISMLTVLALVVAATAQESSTNSNTSPKKNAQGTRLPAGPVPINLPEGITKEQADAILNELRQIRQLLEKQESELARIAVAQSAGFAEPERAQISVGSDWNVIGRTDAPITIVEFTDYECPFCKQFHTGTFTQLKRDYIDVGKVRWVTRDLPLEVHPHALRAAQAARCAGDQGKYWPMYDALLSNDDPPNEDAIKKSADRLSLDLRSFQSCLDSGRHLTEVRRDAAEATMIHITSTPSFVVATTAKDKLDGSVIVGAQQFEIFQRAIESLLSTEGHITKVH